MPILQDATATFEHDAADGAAIVELRSAFNSTLR